MALQLNAEQKYILKIFGDRTKYIIPPYQRAYSWTESECDELLQDLKTAFQKNKSEGYFLGNLVLATASRDDYEVIDGQQRLTTLIMFLKVLWAFDLNNRKLKNTIWILDDRTDEIIEQRVKTNIFIEKDSLSFNEVLNSDYQYEKPKDKRDKFKVNIYFFYERIREFIFQDGNDIKDFIDFILYDVSMLPIHTEGENTAKAREKALTIFETMNNRGMPLDDSDIFKSNLYYMANRTNETDEFISLWKEFDERCEAIDDKLKFRAFKIYSYITRGEQGIKSSEIGLRDFFEKMEYSPFKKKTYKQILDDLSRIVDAIEFFDDKQKQSGDELAKWFQLIGLYTNAFPKDTLIVYLFKNNLVENNDLVEFAKSLVRQSYAKGSTTTIKYDMYDLTIKIMHDKWKTFYDTNYLCPEGFGRLYRGFELLEKYIKPNQLSIYPYKLKRRMYESPDKELCKIYQKFFKG